MSPIGSGVIGNRLIVTCHLILCIDILLLVMGYTQPCGAYKVICWLLHILGGDASSPRGISSISTPTTP
jgi:hypothetical protein